MHFQEKWQVSKNWRSKIGAQKGKTVQQRFWEKVDKGPDCWEWLACKDKDGYGFFRVEGKNLKAHRVALSLAGIKVPDGAFVCHKCDNPSCVNVDHLFVGDATLNNQDTAKKFRKRSQKLTVDDVQRIRDMLICGAVPARVAELFSVSGKHVSHIQQGRKWHHAY